MGDDLAKRSIHSVKWNSISNVFQIVLSFLQSIVLARLLPIPTFGVYHGALSMVMLTAGISNFGMGGAFTYRCKETEDIETTARVHFTLQLLFNAAWTLIMLVGGFIFIKDNADGYLTAYIVLVLCKTLTNFANTPRFMLSRLVQWKRIATVTLIDVTFTFIFAMLLAFLKKPLWALLVTNIVSGFVDIFFMYVWKPVWRPRLKWDSEVVKYFIRFGSNQVVARWLLDALDKVDELWTKRYLGAEKLGLYSKAYSFAQYPSKVLADPVSNVAIGTYSEIAYDRKKLSDAFVRTNSLLVHTGFFLVGILALIAPEFIRVLIGERWMPMMMAFRLMLPFTLFDPMKKTMANLFLAVGKPRIIVNIRFIQLAVMVGGLFALGNLFNIEGVALAVDIMMIVGIIMILKKAKKYVDFSVLKLFGPATLALIAGLVPGFVFDHFVTTPRLMHDILSALIKIGGFSLIFLGVIYLTNKEIFTSMWGMAKKYLFKNNKNKG